MNILDLNKDIELNIISSQIYSLPIFGVFINSITSYPLPKPEFPIDLGSGHEWTVYLWRVDNVAKGLP